ncbi:hypothetical protein HYU13_02040 [Candidatus Woesearchaeota archaeon]|nr:hypothetical protein [Candidatus Woesearchaeota archaeon]
MGIGIGKAIILFVAVVGVLSLLFSITSLVKGPGPVGVIDHSSVQAKPSLGSKFTDFDKALAKNMMDKDNDGMCDGCGMTFDQCVDSGMIECTMKKDSIGVLGSTHQHADILVMKGGKAVNLNVPNYFVKSIFLHVEQEPRESMTGRILHVHAINVPLQLFFDSIGMDVDKLELYTNGQKTLKEGYIPKDGDRILLTDSQPPKVEKEIIAVSDFSLQALKKKNAER